MKPNSYQQHKGALSRKFYETTAVRGVIVHKKKATKDQQNYTKTRTKENIGFGRKTMT